MVIRTLMYQVTHGPGTVRRMSSEIQARRGASGSRPWVSRRLSLVQPNEDRVECP